MTDPARPTWGRTHPRYRRAEVTALVGRGEAVWERASTDVLRWKVKTRSGFEVDDPRPVRAGDRPLIRVHVLGFTIVEPVEVIALVSEPGRVGFAYRTLPGHPVRGEEAFIVHRSGDRVSITVRSLTAASDRPIWSAIHPLLRIAQRVVRRRYLRALR